MDLINLIHKECCKANIKAFDKEGALKTLVELVDRNPGGKDLDKRVILQGLHAREEKGSTGIGGQIAIPHTEVPGLDEFLIVIATSARGVEFDSLDNKKVRMFFLILAPEGRASEHVKVLAGISRALSLSGVKQEILSAETETALYESFVRHLSGGKTTEEMKKKEEMNLLTVYLFDEDLIYDILELFLELGIEGANVTEAYGMGEYISNVPLFAGFLGFMNDRTNRSKEIKALLPESRVEAVVEGIEAITGDLDKTQGAAVIVTPVLMWKGTMKVM